MKINSKLFKEISFFMGGYKVVNSLESGAIENGGATLMSNGQVISNIEKDNFISINKNNNVLRLFIPSTLDVNNSVDNIEFVEKYYNLIESIYPDKTITITNTKGSWYSDTTNSVVIENITILELNIKKVKESDIRIFLSLGLQVKEDMKQDAVSVMCNDALCLV